MKRRDRAPGALLGGVPGALGQGSREMIILQASDEPAGRTSSKRHVGLSQHCCEHLLSTLIDAVFLDFC